MIILRFDDYVVTEYTTIQKRGGGLGGWGSEGEAFEDEARRAGLGGWSLEERAGRVGLGVGVGRWVREGGAAMGAGKMGLVGWGREWWLGGKGRVGEWDLESVKKACW